MPVQIIHVPGVGSGSLRAVDTHSRFLVAAAEAYSRYRTSVLSYPRRNQPKRIGCCPNVRFPVIVVNNCLIAFLPSFGGCAWLEGAGVGEVA